MIKLMHGDCLELMKSIDSNSVDMVFADLPFGTTNCKWDTVIDLNLLWPELIRIAKPNAAILMFSQTPFDKVLGASNLPMLKYEWIWEKTAATGHLNAKKMPMKAHENILVFYKKPPVYNPQKTTGHKPVNSYTKKHNADGECYGKTASVSGGGSTERYPRSVLVFPSDKQKSKLHPTQKPIALLKYLIRTYTNEGDHVFDPTFGAGSMGVAATELNRDFTGMEKDPIHFNVGKERIENT